MAKIDPLLFNPIQVVTTAATEQDAQTLAVSLVSEHLVGCAQVLGPITSIYRWQGKVETSQEWLCVAKTSRDLYSAVERSLREQHPYEVPEILAMPIAVGNDDYLDWLRTQLKGPTT